MSLVLPVLYHWSPETCRASIRRRGLKPTTPTAYLEDSFLAVCLGTSPSHAWSLCGAIWADRGSSWDLWQVTLDDIDHVHVLPSHGADGHRLQEVRVANPIPKARIWHVGSRTVGARRWSCA